MLKQGETTLAHCGVVPLSLSVSGAPEATVNAMAFMDWAGGRQLPGAGIILKKRLMANADVAIVVGGTPDTHAVLPKLGFVPRQQVELFARVVRPLTQAARRPRSSVIKDAARLARNTVWRLTPTGSVPPGWRAVPLASVTVPPAHARESDAIAPVRTAGFVNHWLKCPVGRSAAYEIVQDGQPRGYFLLLSVNGQTRIADMRVSSTADVDLEIACRLATSTAAAVTDTCEVVGAASTPRARRAWLACGYRRRDLLPLYVSDPKQLLGDAPLAWNLVDNDLAYIYDAANPFLT